MHVPEAPVNEYDCPVFREDYIRSAGIAFIMFAVSESCGKEFFADEDLRRCVSTPDVLHVSVPLFSSERIGRIQFLPSGREKSMKYISSSSL